MPPKKEPEVKVSFFSHPDPFVEFVWTVVFIIITIYIIIAFLAMINASIISPPAWINTILDFIMGNSLLMWIFRALMVLLSIILITGTAHFFREVKILRKQENDSLYPETSSPDTIMNKEWEKILNNLGSLSENDWKQAIIGADIMLAGVLNELNLPGDTIGDKLKAVDKSDFLTLDDAWEAHKIRNQIAHDGPSFILTERQVRETIRKYESVFKEFKII